jgi:hypothetical protein
LTRKQTPGAISGVSLRWHLEIIRENLAHCWVAARLYARLEAVAKQSKYRVAVSHVISDALRAHLVMTMSRIWDHGSNNKDCLSFPNLKQRSDLNLTQDQQALLDRLRTDKTITTMNAIRDSFVAHSLAKLKSEAETPIPGSDLQDFINSCYCLLSDIYESEFDQSLGWGDFDEDLQKWEKLIANLEVD